MNLITILENLINEGSSDILYHYIDPKYILEVIENNRLNTVASMGSDTDYKINKKKFYYLSTTRSRSSGYKKTYGKIVLDGRKLKQRYAITPVDYWNLPKSDKQDKSSYVNSIDSLEQEDRIITDMPSIPNAIKYILEVHIYVGENPNNFVKKIVLLCKKVDIPIFLYDKLQNFYSQRNPIEYKDTYTTDLDDTLISKYVYHTYPFKQIAYLVMYNDDDLYKTITQYIDDMNGFENFDDDFKEFKDKFFKKDSLYLDQLPKHIKNQIFNIQSDSSKHSRFILDLLRKDIRKNKATSIEDYVKVKKYGKQTVKDLDEYKKDLYLYLINEAFEEFDNQYEDLEGWIEIDGVTYNNALESAQVQKVLYECLQRLYSVIKGIIFDKDRNILKYFYALDKSHVEDLFDIKNLNISDKLNITNIGNFRTVEQFEETVESIFYYVLVRIENSTTNKANELYKKYMGN
jgi:hypothetical protein